MVNLIGADDIGLEYPNKKIFSQISLGISEGDRIGIVGQNGEGKTSLLELLSGLQEPHSGRITKRSGTKIALLSQMDNLDANSTVKESIIGNIPEYEWASNYNARMVIDELIPGIEATKKVSELSGGQRRRVALAALLIQDWDVLFLDEPSNHLDVYAINFLAKHLRESRKNTAIIMVSHDRWLLDEICTTMWEVHKGKVSMYEGGYAAYILQKAERERLDNKAAEKRNNLLRKELAWLRRGAPARTSKPKFRIEAANELIANEPEPRNSIHLQQLATSRQGKDVAELIDATLSYGENNIIKNLDFILAPGQRIGILGKNGAGKSSLVKLITGEIAPTTGKVKHGKTMKSAVLSQELGELSKLSNTRISEIIASKKSSYISAGKELSPAQLLERLGFRSEQLSARVKELSGGQKRRLQLLLILLDEPNLLILDEPSNDLDTDMLTALEDLLDNWPGTLIVISHDRYFLERVSDDQYCLVNGHFTHLPGGVAQYLKIANNEIGAGKNNSFYENKQNSKSIEAVAASSITGSDKRRLEKELSALDRKIKKTNESITKLNNELNSCDPQDYIKLSDISSSIKGMRVELLELEEQWIEKSLLLE